MGDSLPVVVGNPFVPDTCAELKPVGAAIVKEKRRNNVSAIMTRRWGVGNEPAPPPVAMEES